MSCNRADLHHLITQLHGCFVPKTMFKRVPTPPITEAGSPSGSGKGKRSKGGSTSRCIIAGVAGQRMGSCIC